MSKNSDMLDRLNDVHSFPEAYVFKVIGANSEEFIARVVEVVTDVVGEETEPEVSTRESSEGNHLSVTVTVEMRDADSVLEVYAGFEGLDEARFVL
jgi:putative lipoic acid-binding regulatory protein